ncbi:hypothetical protein KC343_g811 [Hortaea werneckii]|uniref:N-alpha-acetyltransferase 40 n=1 Tax=Hortaea werneckii TaxID=91943 RepID=A0A3M7H2Z9_HORWE|nr:hypothetical protein KC352_g20118 [Hortaea werneckii]KAI7571494.1 hypothetical protein KC317_g1581 [Hortaea werneckii]KAI7623749.1 hypothetical protein KC346_g2566 [Hortaea werneckii]KAI7637254.1 hypothetical protein KC343_g811 [Hortaea werneckii]KAI7652250.1 hypothetical protein KC319_g10717 [Hortaea werneckii]
MGKREVPEDFDVEHEQPPAKKTVNGSGIEDDSDKFIKQVNDMPTEEFSEQYGTSLPSKWELESAKSMSSDHLNLCFSLIEATSIQDYKNSSFGWCPKRKKKEMKEKGMRYVMIERDNPDEPLHGFLSFLPTHDSSPSVPVLYIYEIHLREIARGKGNGKILMQTAMQVAKNLGVEKVMLTCFLSNKKALRFYRKCGFRVDACSPEEKSTRKTVLKPDYVILSRRVNGSTEAENQEADRALEELLDGEEPASLSA